SGRKLFMVGHRPAGKTDPTVRRSPGVRGEARPLGTGCERLGRGAPRGDAKWALGFRRTRTNRTGTELASEGRRFGRLRVAEPADGRLHEHHSFSEGSA